jgi:hypothetical protein
MPFLTLQNTSNLAQYYNSTVNGTFAGTVNNPNVTFSPKPEVPKSSDQFTLSDEGLIRGGATNVILAVKQDENRIGNFLQSDKGRLWTAKQLGLQRSNPLLEYLVNKNTPGTSKTTAEILQSTRLYNVASPINLVASIGGNAFGLHFDRHGLIPVNTYNYEKIATTNNQNQSKDINFEQPNKNTNRLVSYLGTILKNIKDYNNGASINLQTYSSGPNSPYGLGITRISTTLSQRSNYNKTYPSSSTGFLQLQSANPISNTPIKDYSTRTQLFFSPLIVNKKIFNSLSDIEYRVGVSSKSKSDSINMINITDSGVFYTDSAAKKRSSEIIPNTNGIYGRDIIKFRIEFLDNDAPVSSAGVNTQVLAFRAYLDDFSDGMTAKWDPYRYMGRGEEFYVYNGFTRDISVSFTMYAHSPAEMKPLYNKLNYLMSTFAPDYTPSGKMRGNIGYLTVGDYIYRQPGVFTDIKLSGLLDTHWEIALKEDGTIDDTQYEVPKLIKVALSFKPIHTFLPKTGKDVPFVTLDKNAYPVQAGGIVDENGRITKPGTNKYLG